MTNGTSRCCHACGGKLGPVFYEAGPVPVHSCLLLDSAEKAAEFPKGMVRLSACQSCGMVTNLDFDKRWSAYAPNYEDQQQFSPTFGSFAGRLAQDLVARHDLKGATVIDIGCSKGDFLALMCEAGADLGIGVDPSAVEGRVAPPSHGRLDLIQAYYGEEHLSLPADLISCRHTLEHIHDVKATLELMRRHALSSGAKTVFIEVPSMTRVLAEQSFEDIYYEHCSYFTPGALARALRAAGFGVTRLWLDYDDQYLLAEASPDPSDDRSFDIEEPVEETLALVESFEIEVERTITSWRDFVASTEALGQRLAIWGSGSKCIAVMHALDNPQAVSAIVDINPHRHGRVAPGMRLPISAPGDLPQFGVDRILIMNSIYRDEIAESCRSLGLDVEIVALGDRLATDKETQTTSAAELVG